MATVNAKIRKTQKRPPSTKLCLHCSQVRSLADFYSNRDWVEQDGRDVWCKACIKRIKTKDEMRKYFWENHREWKEEIWENAKKRAELDLSKKAIYQKSSEDRRASILEETTCQNIPSLMQINYHYVDTTQDVNTNSYEEAKKEGRIIELKPDPDIKTWSKEFNGNFKPSELEYLEEYYEGLENDFDLNDTSLKDNAKKLAKASLLVDRTQDAYMAGRCSLQDVKDAIAQYDLLMKTGNFAACKRKPGDKAGLNNWAETTMYCETHGHPCVKPVEWEQDVVDLAMAHLETIVTSMNAEEG